MLNAGSFSSAMYRGRVGALDKPIGGSRGQMDESVGVQNFGLCGDSKRRCLTERQVTCMITDICR